MYFFPVCLHCSSRFSEECHFCLEITRASAEPSWYMFRLERPWGNAPQLSTNFFPWSSSHFLRRIRAVCCQHSTIPLSTCPDSSSYFLMKGFCFWSRVSPWAAEYRHLTRVCQWILLIFYQRTFDHFHFQVIILNIPELKENEKDNHFGIWNHQMYFLSM